MTPPGLARSLWVLLFANLHVVNASAQTGGLPGRASVSRPLSNGTELWSEVRRDINRYRWVFGGRTSFSAGGWALNANSTFTSDALVLFNDRLSFRDEYRVVASGEKDLSDQVAIHIEANSDWYSLSRVLSARSYVGARFSPAPMLRVEPRVGVAIDRRPGVAAAVNQVPLRTDAGPAAGWLAQYRTSTDHYRLSIESIGDARRIEPRRDYVFLVRSSAGGAFERTRWSMSAAASSFRRDTYETASFLNRDSQSALFTETIEQTLSDTLAFNGEMNTPLYGRLRFISRADVSFNRRRVRAGRQPPETVFFETDFARRLVEIDARTLLETSRAMWQIGMLLGAESENRTLANRAELPPIQAAQKSTLLQQADSDRGYYGISTSARLDVGRRTTVAAEGLLRLNRHDTPEVNPDDRDERSITARLSIRTRLTPVLNFDTRLFASQYETVYIRAERSAENNTQSSVRLQTNIVWQPTRRTRVSVGPEVRATYTVDAFKLEGRPPRDQSARELRYQADVEHEVARDVRVRANLARSDLRLGRFLESTFSEIPFDTLRATSGQVRIQVGSRHTAEIGVRVFVRSDFNLGARVTHRRRDAEGNLLVDEGGRPLLFTTTRPGRDIVRQVGPVAAVAWNLRDASVLRIDGWLTFQKQYHRLYGDLPALDADEIRRAARQGTDRIIPNVAMSVIWRL